VQQPVDEMQRCAPHNAQRCTTTATPTLRCTTIYSQQKWSPTSAPASFDLPLWAADFGSAEHL